MAGSKNNLDYEKMGSTKHLRQGQKVITNRSNLTITDCHKESACDDYRKSFAS